MPIISEFLHRPPPPRTKARPGCDRFGFVPEPVSCVFDGGEIQPVDNFERVAKWVATHRYRRNRLPLSARSNWMREGGILFPPLADERYVREIKDRNGVTVPNSVQPAVLHKVPASHYLRLDDRRGAAALREEDSAFVTKLLGFLYDSGVQFHDWSFDGAVSIGHRQLHPRPPVLKDFLSHSYRVWRGWPREPQQLMIATLKMHGRAPGHQWYWERFSWEYTVTDACYRLGDQLFPGSLRMPSKKPSGKQFPHAQRIHVMIRAWGLHLGAEESDWVDLFVRLRNELIHEARWAGHQPSTKTPTRAAYAPGVVHLLNQRLITALLGYANDFVRMRWHRGLIPFGAQS